MERASRGLGLDACQNEHYVRRVIELVAGSNVHHCHIVEHEDNDMMRPFIVTA